jgi:hypothetical protein
VSKGEGPQAQVRGSVGNGAEDILDGMDALVNEDFSNILLLMRGLRLRMLQRVLVLIAGVTILRGIVGVASIGQLKKNIFVNKSS